MNDKALLALGCAIFGFAVGMLFGVSAAGQIAESDLDHKDSQLIRTRQEAVARGYAEYVVTRLTGKTIFVWKETPKIMKIGAKENKDE